MHLCAFLSQKRSRAECNYDIGNRELLAVKVTLEELETLAGGSRATILTIRTHHKNLEYLQSAKRLNFFFNRFHFHLSYRPGSKNVKPDALSRIYSSDPVTNEPEPILPLSCVLGAVH